MVAERGIAINSLEAEIRERKASQAQLEQSEQELRGLFNNVHDSIIIYNLTDHSILEVNERACEIYGYSREEFLNMRIEAITKKPSRIARCVKETLVAGNSTHFEMVQLRKDGRERLMDANTSVVKYKGEKAILSIYQDISEKRLAEVALRSSEEKYSNLFQFSNDCIIIYDLAGRLLDCNEQVLSKFGIIDAEVTSLNISRFYPKEQHALLTSATADLIRKGYVRFEIDVVSKNGTIWPAEVSANLFRMNNKKVVQAVFRDITERKEAERRQQALYRIAEITTFSDDMDEFYAAIHAVVGQLTYAEN
ncbi:MAG: PAS domain-containing protein, partial [Calditrichota bacterium]